MITIHYREAMVADIPQMHAIRMRVRENVLSNPLLVQEADYVPFLTTKGKGWVACSGEQVLGFAIIDFQEHNVWALFLDPPFEAQGIGKELHRMMMGWYFNHYSGTIWLSTAYDTRADRFYRMQGWRDQGAYSAKERKYEMNKQDWEECGNTD